VPPDDQSDAGPRPGHDGTEVGAVDVLLRFAEFGRTITVALESVVAHPELAHNSSLITLAAITVEGPQRPSDIQRRTGLTSGGVTKLLQRLEEQGLVDRLSGTVPGDRRAVEVTITAEGRRVMAALAAELAGQLGEVDGFLRDATELIAGMRHLAEDGAPAR
jgi:DNA-binding MarR family transcriptional regulator